MREIIKKYKREVCVGIVVSLITTVIWKCGDWLIAIAPAAGTSIFGALTNMLYFLAATYTDNFVLRLFIFCVLGVLTGTIIQPVKDGIKIYKSALALEKRSKVSSTETQNDKAEIDMREVKAREKREASSRIPQLIKDGKQVGKSTILLIISVVFTYVFVVFCLLTPMRLHNEFEQDLLKIAPYIEESEITRLKSDWVYMRSKSEYDAIYTTIDEVKADHSLPQ